MHSLLRHHRTLLTFSALTTTIATTAILSTRPLTTQPPKQTMSPTTPLPYTPRHKTFPYTPRDLTPEDTNPDTTFYSTPRFVTHIDDNAISLLSTYYAHSLPTRGHVLDLCTSWISHFPSTLSTAATSTPPTLHVAGIGMSAPEMRNNDVLAGNWAVHDLNASPTIPAPSTLFKSTGDATAPLLLDATTCVVSIDYLTSPVEVLASVRQHTVPGGTVHLVVSNRCFPTKAVRRWLRINEDERLQMVGDYLWFAGWRDIEIVTLSDGTLSEADVSSGQAGQGMSAFMRMLGMAGNGCDPLWVVRARKVDDSEIAETTRTT